jgi:hypothetical protein
MPNPNKLICPLCKQPLAYERVGIRLPPLKAKIFDAIKASGDEGITSAGVISSAYQGRERPPTTAIKAHVWQINSLLEETDLVISSDRRVRDGNTARWRLRLR